MADLYDTLAERLVRGSQEAFVEELTARLADQLSRDVDNPDAYALSVGVARERALGVWEEWRERVCEEAREAFEEALAQADEECVRTLAAEYGRAASAGLTAQAENAIAEAARGMAQIARRQNVALAQTAADAYWAAVADAIARTQLGESREAVMERAWTALADAGIETVDYRSGVHTTIDAAMRRHVVTQASQCRADLLMRRMDEWGHDLVYTSAHFGARPSHSTWQGHVFSRSGRDKRYPSLAAGTGYGTVAGLCGANCRHTFYPYVEGLTRLPSTDFSQQERLTGMTSDEYYAATQRQRALERRVRATKREVAVGQAQGLDMAAKRAELGVAQRRLREHCAAKGLHRDYSREKAYGVAEQPRALRLSVAENTARADAKAYGVDRRRVGSKGYASLVRSVFGACGEAALADARRMLAHRGGTACEDLYAYDLTEGRRIASVTTSKARQRVEPDARMRRRVEAAVAQGHEVATLHNHPGSTMPSAGDILTLRATGARLGVIAAHDGTVYTYEVVGSPAPGYTVDDKSLRLAYDKRRDDEEGAFKAIEQLFGVRIVHLAQGERRIR